ncbi:unnamed protein product [Pelagomonas calceolata]|uniref:Haem-binding uptake Tiki superfamily ChaN domain-containing protein n=2 Tax=Pelagomonas calceolata TaxID=35677 RepID=A0A8J2WWU3_9STRA|nr:unnamed protein product [Pelagomonas calceolata]
MMNRLVAVLAAATALEPVARRTLLKGVPAAAALATPALAADNALQKTSCFEVIPDSSLALKPKLTPIKPDKCIGGLKAAKALYLGEHHNSLRDHLLQADILRALRRSEPRRPMAVGLEAIQRRFQPVLDDYLRGAIGLEQLEQQTEWSTRWTWPFANYVPVFEAARLNNFELLALNADSEDLGVVEMGGLAGLPNATLAKYIPDRRVFADFTNTTAFREYIAYVVAPSYRSHKEMGILRQTISGQQLKEDMPFKNFYSGRMLWDNSMANTGAVWTRKNPSGLLVSVIGADHVKFGGGVPNRYAYAAGLDLDKVRTVILNPSAVDTAGPQLETLRADAPVPLTLQIRFAAAAGDGGIPVINGDAVVDVAAAARVKQVRPGSRVLPFSDVLWLSAEDA